MRSHATNVDETLDLILQHPLVTRSRKRRHSSAASLDLSLGESSARTVSWRCGNARTELRVAMRGCFTFSIFGRQWTGSQTSSSTRSICRNCERSEEHTSELQSLMRISYAVFCLKKKKTKKPDTAKSTNHINLTN